MEISELEIAVRNNIISDVARILESFPVFSADTIENFFRLATSNDNLSIFQLLLARFAPLLTYSQYLPLFNLTLDSGKHHVFRHLLLNSPLSAWSRIDAGTRIGPGMDSIVLELGFSMMDTYHLQPNSFVFENDILIWTKLNKKWCTKLLVPTGNWTIEDIRSFVEAGIEFNPFLLHHGDPGFKFNLNPFIEMSFLTGDLQDHFANINNPVTAFKALFSHRLDLIRHFFPLDAHEYNLELQCKVDLHVILEGLRLGGVEALRLLEQKVNNLRDRESLLESTCKSSFSIDPIPLLVEEANYNSVITPTSMLLSLSSLYAYRYTPHGNLANERESFVNALKLLLRFFHVRSVDFNAEELERIARLFEVVRGDDVAAILRAYPTGVIDF